MVAYDYPLLGLFWTMLIWFLWIAWLILLFRVFVDIFRNDEMRGVAKALWSLFVLIVPFLGVFVYILAHGDSMTKRDIDQARQRQADFEAYVRETAGSGGGGAADELTKLADLRDRGVISDEEFASAKAKLLA